MSLCASCILFIAAKGGYLTPPYLPGFQESYAPGPASWDECSAIGLNESWSADLPSPVTALGTGT